LLTALIILRWIAASVLGLAWLGFLVIGIADCLRTSGGKLAKTGLYHVSILLGMLVVVLLPLGELGERAPYALIALLPEIVWPLDLLLAGIRHWWGTAK